MIYTNEMNLLKAKFLIIVFFAIIISIVFSCNKTINTIEPSCGVCSALAVLPTVSFKYVDKITGNNLFFGNQPAYKISQLKVSRLYNGNNQDLIFFTDSIGQSFSIGITPKTYGGDTITMQIANLPIDKLIVKTHLIGLCCPYLTTDSVFYNGNLVHTAANGPNVIAISK